MAPNEVIDLLSSDDEAPLKPMSKRKDIVTTTTQDKSEFLYLSDGLDTTVRFDHEWIPGPSKKRRKLSTSTESDDHVPVRSQLPRLKRHSSPRAAVREKHQVGWSVDESDPIMFTSSLGAASHAKRRASETMSSHGEESDESLPDDLLSVTLRHTKVAPALSERTALLLESLSQPISCPKPSAAGKRSNDKATTKPKIQSENSVEKTKYDETKCHAEGSSKGGKAPARNSKLTEEEKAAKAREREHERTARAKAKEGAKIANNEQRARGKEEDHEKKRQLKEEKAREKRIAADLAEVNKSKLDKKDSIPEIIVDLPATIDGQSVDTQIREFLKNLGADATLYQSPIPNVIRWRRKMKARWNAELDHWEPIERLEIHEEKHVMFLVSAKDFITLAMAQQEDQDLETHVAMLKSAYTDCVPIYMVEGLHLWLRKNKTAENRAYQAKVLSQAHADDLRNVSQPVASKRKKFAPEVIDEDMIEDALLRLQVMHGCLVHHTHTSVETAEWVANFTQHISTIPYRSVPSPPRIVSGLTILQIATHELGHIILHGVRSSQDRRGQRRHICKDAARSRQDHSIHCVWYCI